jgi:DNA-nicking Smr family endonuclease
VLDRVWIPQVTGQGWLIITRDANIADNRAEIDAVRTTGARMVALAGREAIGTWAQLEVLMSRWRDIEALLNQPGPFIYSATRTRRSVVGWGVVPLEREDDTVKLKLDLHEMYNRGEEIDRALRAVIDEAITKKAPLVEIIPGKGSGALKKRVLRFLNQPEIKALYHRVEKDSDNFGRIFVHFRWK